ncbi:MAG: hypothetical protein ACE5KM_10130 [Planctomycetaceae bacterium]
MVPKTLSETPRDGRSARIAVRCSLPNSAVLQALRRLGEPVDLWLHPRHQTLRPRLERHPNVRRVFFSPVKDAGDCRDSGRTSLLPVYGRYDDVLELEDVATTDRNPQ